MTYRVTCKLDEMDFDTIYDFISNSYWAKEIPQNIMQRALENSLCFAVLEGEKLVGFARLITDSATFAYLADVFILPEHQKKGLSRLLMDELMQHDDIKGLRRIMLATLDAHGLYEKYNFKKIDDPSMLMQIHDPSVYTQDQ